MIGVLEHEPRERAMARLYPWMYSYLGSLVFFRVSRVVWGFRKANMGQYHGSQYQWSLVSGLVHNRMVGNRYVCSHVNIVRCRRMQVSNATPWTTLASQVKTMASLRPDADVRQ